MTDRTVATRLVANNSNFDRAYLKSKAIASDFANQLDTTDGRMTNLIQTGMALGPALVPALAAGGAAAVALGSGLAAAATGMGVAALAFQGVGDALSAVNDYQLDPTVENLEKAREALRQMSPAGAEFVGFLQKLRPKMQELQNIAQQGLLPGMQEGIGDLMTSFPTFERIVGNLSTAMGNLSAEAGEALSGPFWDDFFQFIATDGVTSINTFGRAFGNFATAFAGVAMSFDPLADDFGTALLDMSERVKEWGTTLDDNEGFQNFVDFVRDVSPQVWDTFGALANALIQLTQAAAPVGQAVLPIVELLANGLAAIADSPAGPVLIGLAAGLSAIARAVALYNIANGSAMMNLIGPGIKDIGKSAGDIKGASTAFLDYGAALDTTSKKANSAVSSTERLKKSLGGIGKAGAGIAGMTLLMSDFDDQTGVSNTATLGLLGTMAGPWGAVIGGSIGLMMDLSKTNDDFRASFDKLEESIGSFNLSDSSAQLQDFQSQLSGMESELTSFGLHSFKPGNVAETWEGILGTNDLEEFEEKWRDARDSLAMSMNTLSSLRHELSGSNAPLAGYSTNLATLQDTADTLVPKLEAMGWSTQRIQDLMSDGVGFDQAVTDIRAFNNEQDSMAGRSQGVLDALAGLDSELLSTAESAEALETALDELLGPGLNLSEARDAWVTSLRSLREELNKSNRSLVGNSNAAIQNRAAIRGRVESMVDVLNAEAAAGTSAAGLSRIFLKQRGALLDAAAAAGVSRRELRGYLTELGFTPKMVNTIIRNNAEERERAIRGYVNTLRGVPRSLITTISQPGFEASDANIKRLAAKYEMTPKQVRTIIQAVDNASSILGGVEGLLNRLDGRNVTTTVTTNYVNFYQDNPGGRSLYNADGNIVEYDDGGVHTETGARVPRVPQIVKGRGRGIRWGEAETGWEAYISGKPGMRERNRGVLNEAARRLGMDRRFADGGTTGEEKKGKDPGSKPLTEKTIKEIVAEIRDRFGKNSPLVDTIQQWLEGLKRSEFSQKALADRIDKALGNELGMALREFNVGPRQTKGETRGELNELLRSLRETFGPDAPVVSRTERLGDRLLNVAEKQDKAAARYERANNKLDAIVDKQREFASEVRSAFTHDAFGDDINSVRDSLVQMRADANDAERTNRQLHRLGRKGLNDSVMRSLAASGNTALISQLSRMSPKQIAAYERAFDRRNREVGQLGRFAGRRVFGDERQAATRIAHRTERTLNQLNHRLGRIEKDIERGAERGTRRGMNDRRHAQRRRRRSGAVR